MVGGICLIHLRQNVCQYLLTEAVIFALLDENVQVSRADVIPPANQAQHIGNALAQRSYDLDAPPSLGTKASSISQGQLNILAVCAWHAQLQRQSQMHKMLQHATLHL